MTIAHYNSTPLVRNKLADLVADEVDLGAGDAQGDLIFMASADAEVATLLCNDPAFGAASAGTVTIDPGIADDTNATGGTIIAFKFQNKANQEVFRGSVTTTAVGTGDIWPVWVWGIIY